jgi:hypothetical protein
MSWEGITGNKYGAIKRRSDRVWELSDECDDADDAVTIKSQYIIFCSPQPYIFFTTGSYLPLDLINLNRQSHKTGPRWCIKQKDKYRK